MPVPFPQVGRSRDSVGLRVGLPWAAPTRAQLESGSGLQSWIEPCRLEEQEELLSKLAQALFLGPSIPQS